MINPRLVFVNLERVDVNIHQHHIMELFKSYVVVLVSDFHAMKVVLQFETSFFRFHGASYACYWCQCACVIVGTLACNYGNHRTNSYDMIDNTGMTLICDGISNLFCYTGLDTNVQIRCPPVPCDYIPFGTPANNQINVFVSSIQWF